jgi:hypothetical protein
MQHISFSLQIDLLEKLPIMYTRAERERERERGSYRSCLGSRSLGVILSGVEVMEAKEN